MELSDENPNTENNLVPKLWDGVWKTEITCCPESHVRSWNIRQDLHQTVSPEKHNREGSQIWTTAFLFTSTMERLNLEIPGKEPTYKVHSLYPPTSSFNMRPRLMVLGEEPMGEPHIECIHPKVSPRYMEVSWWRHHFTTKRRLEPIPGCERFSWSSDLVYLVVQLSTTLRNGKAVWGKAKQPTPQWRLFTGRINARPEEDSPTSSYPLVNCAKETSKFYSAEQNQGLIHQSPWQATQTQRSFWGVSLKCPWVSTWAKYEWVITEKHVNQVLKQGRSLPVTQRRRKGEGFHIFGVWCWIWRKQGWLPSWQSSQIPIPSSASAIMCGSCHYWGWVSRQCRN